MIDAHQTQPHRTIRQAKATHARRRHPSSARSSSNSNSNSNSNSEVSLSADVLAVELDTLNDALNSLDRLLKRDVRERNDFKAIH